MLSLKIENEIFKNLQDEFQIFAKIFTGKIAELNNKIRENEFKIKEMQKLFEISNFQKQDELNDFKNELVTQSKEKLFHEITKFKLEKAEIIDNLEKRQAELVLKNEYINFELKSIEEVQINLEAIPQNYKYDVNPNQKVDQSFLMKKSFVLEQIINSEEQQIILDSLNDELTILENKKIKIIQKFENQQIVSQIIDNENLTNESFKIDNFQQPLNFLNLNNLCKIQEIDLPGKTNQTQKNESIAQKIANLREKSNILKTENCELNSRKNAALNERKKKTEEFERIMFKMQADFQEKKTRKRSSKSLRDLDSNVISKNGIQKQEELISVLQNQLEKLELVKQAKNNTSLVELWQQNANDIELLSQFSGSKNLKITSEKKIIMGSEEFEDFEIKTSIDGSAKKYLLRNFRSQSPSRFKAQSNDAEFRLLTMGSVGEIESVKFTNNSEFSEVDFSKKKRIG